MGLKTDILKAFEKNLTHIEIVDNKSTTVKPPIEKDSKLEVLAEDLANAILDFLTDEERCVLKVDKLLASVGPVKTAPAPLASTPAAVGAPVFTTLPPISVITVAVDKNGHEGGNPIGGGLPQSNASEVRLRKDNIKGESDKY